MGPARGTLFLHYPCFDGLVSAALAADVLERAKGWTVAGFHPVNYDRARTWLDTELPQHSAVVDFRYHPGAEFWADHHATSFPPGASWDDIRRDAAGRTLLYDRSSLSCAMLIWKNFEATSSDPVRYADMARWADRIDGAQYASVDEAVFGTEPAMTINTSLAKDADDAYGARLFGAMRRMALDEVAALPDVRARAESVRARMNAGLGLVKDSIRLQPGEIAVVEVQPRDDAIVNRYSPYCFFPDARYSVVLVRSATDAKITAMRNPWREFESVPLGSIFQRYGGGGHQRVASVTVPAGGGTDAGDVLAGIVRDIRAQVR